MPLLELVLADPVPHVIIMRVTEGTSQGEIRLTQHEIRYVVDRIITTYSTSPCGWVMCAVDGDASGFQLLSISSAFKTGQNAGPLSYQVSGQGQLCKLFLGASKFLAY